MKILDLFCGAGGFSCGFLDPGNTFIGVDAWDVALETYRNNIKGETIIADINTFDPSTIGKIDILIGSPPCQPHSTANRNATHDPTLIQRYMDIKNELKPRWWIMEEVPGAVNTGIIDVEHQRYFNATDFGLPHVRKRLFAGNYPEPVKNPYQGKEKLFPTPLVAGHNAGGWNSYQVREIKRRIGINGPIPVSFVSGLMGFPKWYVFHGKKSDVFKQIGNAVCPPISRAIWGAIASGKPARKRQLSLGAFFDASVF